MTIRARDGEVRKVRPIQMGEVLRKYVSKRLIKAIRMLPDNSKSLKSSASAFKKMAAIIADDSD